MMGFVAFASTIKSTPVDSITAKTVAGCFYSQNCGIKNISLKLGYIEKSYKGQAEYYIYNIYPAGGFVIVSADDAAYPIIGYSSEGYYRPDNISPEFSFWMKRYKTQIASIRQHNIKATANIQNEWKAYKNNLPLQSGKSMRSSVGPLVKTIWAQAPYYNASCPVTVVDGVDSNDVAGCVATAMAQIMKYWAYPPHGISSNSYSLSPYGVLYANFDTTHYNWAAMPNNVTRNNSEVATLMYDCGVSVDMEYTVDNSGAYVANGDVPSHISAQSAFSQYFGYSGSSMQAVYESNYSYANWVSLIENELNSNRPVLYSGSGDDGGHAWVCDGYNSATDQFHMNWGWAGYEDGYYSLNSLNPDNIPLGTGEEALIGIEPAPAVADFTAAPLIIRAGDTVTFTDNSIAPVPLVAWQWSLPGTLTTSSGTQNPAVVYETPGTYNVTETATSSEGSGTTSHFNYIIVLDNSSVNVYPTVSNGNLTIQLHDPSLTSKNITFSVYTMLGEKVYTTTLMQYVTQLTLSVQPGMYFFRAFDALGKPVSTGKLVIE